MTEDATTEDATTEDGTQTAHPDLVGHELVLADSTSLVPAPEVLDGELVDDLDIADVGRLTPDARAVIAGLVAPSWEVNHDGITPHPNVWTEIRRAFPLQKFWDWVAAHSADADSDDSVYDAFAGE